MLLQKKNLKEYELRNYKQGKKIGTFYTPSEDSKEKIMDFGLYYSSTGKECQVVLVNELLGESKYEAAEKINTEKQKHNEVSYLKHRILG